MGEDTPKTKTLPTIITKKIGDLKPWDKNPRQASDEDLDRLKAQIEKLGMYKPLLINQDNIILGGNMRYRVLKIMEAEEIMCSVVETHNEKEMLEYALSDNDNVGEYRKRDLAELVKVVDLKDQIYRVDLNANQTLKNLQSMYTTDDNDDFINPKLDKFESKSGEIYQLGKHRLMCGDSTKLEDVQKLMADNKANMVFTDPPYFVDYRSNRDNSYNKGLYKHSDKKDTHSDDTTEKEISEFYGSVFKNLYEVTTDNVVLYLWLATRRIYHNLIALKRNKLAVIQIIIWVKENTSFKTNRFTTYLNKYEPCILAYKPGNKVYKNRLNNKDTDVWFIKRDKVRKYMHPTQKPIELAVKALRVSSQIDDIVLDLFGGSGSTLIACEKNNRICYTMEIDPYYCDIIRMRYAKLIGHANDWQKVTPKIKAKEEKAPP